MATAAVVHFMSPSLQKTPKTPVNGSTDYLSPARRRRRDAPLLLSAQNTLPQNDDAAEKKRRYISSVTGIDLQSPTPNSPRTVSRIPESERSKTPSVSNVRVTDVYAMCIQLSAENKITYKNAFNLELIDLLQEVVKSNQKGEVTNFQVASCTLDAGGKIYAGRVDSIHHQTFKMLGGLGRADTNNNDNEDDNGAQAANKKTRKEKQHKPGNTIESNLSNMDINKLDLDFEVDPVFNSLSDSVFEEGGLSGSFLNNLQNKHDGELLVDSSRVVGAQLEAPVTSGEATSQESTLDHSHFRGLHEKVTSSAEPIPICPYFADFNFTNWDSSDQEEFEFMAVGVQDATRAPAFNINDSVTELPPDAFPDEDLGDDHCGEDYDDFDEMGENMGRDGCHRNMPNNNITLAFIDGPQPIMLPAGQNRHPNTDGQSGNSNGELCLEVSSKQSDYGYFGSEALATWAGPDHWKLKQRLAKYKGSSSGNQESNQEAKQRKKKEKFFIDFDAEIDFKKSFSKTKAATVLAKATLAKMCESNVTLPNDECDHEMLVRFTLKKQIKLMRQNLTDKVLDDDADWYNYDNPKDQQNFCPDLQGDDDDDDVDNGDDFGGCTDFSQDTVCDFTQANSIGSETCMDQTALGGDDLVAEPNKVEKIDINYSKTAKRLNVKKLKYSMWNILTDKQQDKENVPAVNEVVTDKEENVITTSQYSFVEMYKELPGKISHHMAKNLSVPIAFVCLLHLANEKILKIQGRPDMSDFIIEQEGVTKSISEAILA